MNQPRGIEGLTPRDGVGAVLSVGIKNPQGGFPVEKDRFHLLMPKASEGTGRQARRVHHPAYRAYNSLPAERRRQLYGALVHAHQEECFEYNLKAQVITGLSPSRSRPACVGDGKIAQRWDNDAGDYKEIVCPHEKCQYRLCDPAACKPWMRLVFRVVWPAGLADGEWPSQLVRLTSGGWNTCRNALGLFKEIERAASELRIKDYSLYGYPFMLTLVEQTSPEKKAKFPVVHFSATVSPEAFFISQQERLAQMGERYPALADMQDPEVVYEDQRQISIPGGF